MRLLQTYAVAMRLAEPDPDLAALPDAVRAAAHVFHNGEVAWPNDDAESAINAPADTGKLILGLDARTLHPDGGVMEIPVSAWRSSPARRPKRPLNALGARRWTPLPSPSRRAPTCSSRGERRDRSFASMR